MQHHAADGYVLALVSPSQASVCSLSKAIKQIRIIFELDYNRSNFRMITVILQIFIMELF